MQYCILTIKFAESLSHELQRRRVAGVGGSPTLLSSALLHLFTCLHYSPALLHLFTCLHYSPALLRLHYSPALLRFFTCLHYYAGEWEEWGNPNERKYFEYMLQYRCV